MDEKVDIIMTTYNSNIKYLKIQLDSILNQTYKNIKLIISDDCSTNKEVIEVLKQYKENDNRIELYLREENIGYTKNFEYALSKSTAYLIAFSDHDDFWYENKIEESVKILKEKNVDLVYCDSKQIDEDGKILHESYLRYKNMPIINGKESIIPFSRHIAIGCSQLFTKKVKEKMLPFTENTIAHDWNSVYIASRLNGIYCIDKPLFNYRLHGNNAFGGRSFKENMQIWKKENGNNYNGYLKYRHKVIVDTYLAGSLMCRDYGKRLDIKEPIKKYNLEILEEDVIKYYETAQKSKIIYFPIHKYFKYLYFTGIGKRLFKEIMILHFPLLSYIVYAIS